MLHVVTAGVIAALVSPFVLTWLLTVIAGDHDGAAEQFSLAASLAASGALNTNEIIMALLVGNILSSPVRAVRHQFPSYAGFFGPGAAVTLVAANQICRAASLVITAGAWYAWAF